MALIVARGLWRVNATAIIRSIPFVVNGRREPSAGECRSDFSYGKHCFPWVHRRRTLRRSSAAAVPLIIAHQSASTVSLIHPTKSISSRGRARATRSRHRRSEHRLSSLCREVRPCAANPARGPIRRLGSPFPLLERDPRTACLIVENK